MALINIRNPAAKAAFAARKLQVTFTTDAVAGISNTITTGANGNSGTFGSTPTGFSVLDAVTITNAGPGGNTPWYPKLGTISGSTAGINIPSARTAVTTQPITRWERFQTQYRPNSITLLNKSNGDTYKWTEDMLIRTAWKTEGSTGIRTLVTGNNIWCDQTAFYIHPDILPVSTDFSVEMEFTK